MLKACGLRVRVACANRGFCRHAGAPKRLHNWRNDPVRVLPPGVAIGIPFSLRPAGDNACHGRRIHVAHAVGNVTSVATDQWYCFLYSIVGDMARMLQSTIVHGLSLEESSSKRVAGRRLQIMDLRGS